VRKSTPAITSRLANVWRRECQVKSTNAAAFTAGSQIVYEAVWADTSDSTKTYDNAAHALLNELRKRAGVTQTFGILRPLSD